MSEDKKRKIIMNLLNLNMIENLSIWDKVFLISYVIFCLLLLSIVFNFSIKNWSVWKKVFIVILYSIFFFVASYISGKVYIKTHEDTAANLFHIGGYIFLIIIGIFPLYLWISTGEFVRYAFIGISLILYGLAQLFIIWRFLH